jgi:hypothetical protein
MFSDNGWETAFPESTVSWTARRLSISVLRVIRPEPLGNTSQNRDFPGETIPRQRVG